MKKEKPGDIIILHHYTKSHDPSYTVPEIRRLTDVTVILQKERPPTSFSAVTSTNVRI